MSRPPDIVSFYYFKDGQEPHRIDVGVPPYTARRRIREQSLPPQELHPQELHPQELHPQELHPQELHPRFPQNDLPLFQELIHEIEGNASRRTKEGDKNSLLHNVQMYKYAFNKGMFDFDYIRNFHDKYVEGKIPFQLIPKIFDQVKKYTGINITSYNREERRDRVCSILKGCMIYRDVYEHFKDFTFKRDVHRKITKDQDIPNETLDIPNELKDYILQNWGGLGIDVLNSLITINPNVYGVIMFQFYNLIFVIPVKRIGLVWKIIDTEPIPLTDVQSPPQINPSPILHWRQIQRHPLINPPPQINPRRRKLILQSPPPPPLLYDEDSIPPQFRISNLMNPQQNSIQWF